MLLVSLVIFQLVKWLNTKIKWSIQTSILRTFIDILLFSCVTIGWIILVNFIIFDLVRGEPLTFKQVVFFAALGTIINLFLVPLIEFVVLMNVQHETELNSKQLQHENTKFRYEILKNQINPHFLFNSLGVLNSLITESPEKSKLYLSSFSNVLRHVLDFREYNSIALEDEAKFLADYIFLLNIRFENTFEAKVDLPPRFTQRQILPMVLQLLIENVIKHNKMSESQPIVVNIQATEEGVEVWNKIRLKSSVSSWGIGLENIKMRYASLGHKIAVENDGRIFKICIPYL
ncbi:MAG: histidine kinase [Saprospiraceae bacterium]|nr:histidine kinase [Saprospiraceae bacterium]